MDASWTTTPAPAVGLDELRARRVLGVDLNADHLTACVLDAAGNLIGAPVTIAVETTGLRASRCDGRVRAAITALLDLAERHHRIAVVVENLDFADTRATGRENPGPRPSWQAAAPYRGRHPHRPIPHPADRDGVPARYRCDRCGSGLHLPAGVRRIGVNPCNNRLPPSRRHHTSWCGGRDRQTWTRHGDQASVGWTPTAHRCGHESSAACPPTRNHTTVPWFGSPPRPQR